MLRADDLAQLTPAGLEALGEYGVATVLDLRWPEEAARYPSPVPLGLPQVRDQRVSLLTHTEDEWRLRSRDVVKELWKCVVLERARQELKQVLQVIASAAPGPIASRNRIKCSIYSSKPNRPCVRATSRTLCQSVT